MATDEPDADPAIVAALLDMATVWRCWCLLQHRDGRILAGRAGDIRIFGTVMLRLDAPEAAGTSTILFNTAAVDDVLVCTEREAREAAAVTLGEGEALRAIVAAALAARAGKGGADGLR